MHRFVTFGSPLDKIAVLFGRSVLHTWPEVIPILKENWWVNFYHVLDPVSGALSHPMMNINRHAPLNYHLKRFFRLPGLAHVAYWNDATVLRYLFSRFYGIKRVRMTRETPLTADELTRNALVGYCVWFALTVGVIIALVLLTLQAVGYLSTHTWAEVFDAVWRVVK